MKNCETCPFKGKKRVLPEGNINARIMLIGEAPGTNEETFGKPFIGGAGRLLKRIMQDQGILWENCYVTNVLKCRPPGNNIKLAVSQEAIQHCLPNLYDEINQVHPALIVPLGNTALSALGIHGTISKIRGAVLRTEYGKVIPTFHPAYILRQPQEVYTAVRDWVKIGKAIYNNSYTEYVDNFNLNPTLMEIKTFVDQIKQKVYKRENVVLGMDIETTVGKTTWDNNLICIGIAPDKDNAIVIPVRNIDGSWYFKSDEDNIQLIMAIGSLLEDPNITKIFHNALFDVMVLMNLGFTVSGAIFDTMIGQYLVYSNSKHDLQYVTSLYTDYPPWKVDTNWADDQSIRDRNARDSVVLQMLKPAITEDLKTNNVWTLFNMLMKRIIPISRIMNNGIYVDKEAVEKNFINLTQTTEALKLDLQKLADTSTFNPNSSIQLTDILFDKFKLKSQIKTPKGKLSTGKNVLTRLSIRYPKNKFIKELIEYRNLEKLLTTYGKPYIHPDNRVRTHLLLHGTVTGRFASREPNLQNLPGKTTDKELYIRKMYSVPPGYVMVEADFSQAEVRVFAQLANDPILLEAFKQGEDIHKNNAIDLFGEYKPEFRLFAKRFIYSIIYGSGGAELQESAPKEVLKRGNVITLLNKFLIKHSAIAKYQLEIEQKVLKEHKITNPFGRIRWYSFRPTKADIRSAINFPIQSTVGDIMHIKLSPLDSLCQMMKSKIILQLHDAYYIEVPESKVEKFVPALKFIMEAPVVASNNMSFSIPVSIETGNNMGELHEWK